MLNQEPLPEEPSPEEPAIESLLAGFAPKENAIDRERLMFLAGYQAGKQELEKLTVDTRKANRRWKFLTFVSTAAAASLAMLWLPSLSSSVVTDRNHAPPVVDANPVETPKAQASPQKTSVVAMSTADEPLPPRGEIGPENGFLRLREQVLREEALALVEQTEARGGGVSRPPATQRQLYLDLPVELRETLSPADKGSSLQGSSRLGERS